MSVSQNVPENICIVTIMIIWLLVFYILILVYKIEVHDKSTSYNRESEDLLIKKSKRIVQAHMKKWNISDYKNTITGPVVERLSGSAASQTYIVLRNITNQSILQYIRQNCNGNVTKEFCSYKNKTNLVISKRNKNDLKYRYDKAFSINSNSSIYAVNYSMLPNKKPIKGTVIHKFVGNVETNVIFTPENRIIALLL